MLLHYAKNIEHEAFIHHQLKRFQIKSIENFIQNLVMVIDFYNIKFNKINF